jgi:NADPH:quinone reductase
LKCARRRGHLDSIGGQNLIDSIGVLAYRGTLVSVGVVALGAQQLAAQRLSRRRGHVECARVHPMIADMLERVARGDLQVEIDRSFPLSNAAAAHEYAERR